MRMVAIHNRVLTPEQIMQNFDAGVGEKYFMLFNVSHLVNVPEAYMMLEASQLDSYGIQFTKPTFISLDPNASVANIPIAGIRIGLNGDDHHPGQTYIPLNATIGGANYVAGTGQQLTADWRGDRSREGRGRRRVLPVLRAHRRQQPSDAGSCGADARDAR
jgi:hypothetical protein